MQKLSRHIIYYLSILLCFSFSLIAKNKPAKEKEISQETALKWAKTTLDFTQMQPYKTPTFISRSLAYIGITMYESVVNSSSKYKSIASELNGLGILPKSALALTKVRFLPQ